MKNIVYFGEKPNAITLEAHKLFADIWMRKNITSEETEEGIQWHAEEVYGRLNSNIPTLEDLETNFDIWYNILSKWEPEQPITFETITKELLIFENTTNSNLKDLEDAVLELGEIIGGM